MFRNAKAFESLDLRWIRKPVSDSWIPEPGRTNADNPACGRNAHDRHNR